VTMTEGLNKSTVN